MKNRLPSAAIILLPLADSEAPGKSEPTLTGSSSPAEKLYHFLKLISPEYYESKEPHSETQWPAKKYICLPFVRLAVERLQDRILFNKDIPGDKMLH